jgi:hypothetical protein
MQNESYEKYIVLLLIFIVLSMFWFKRRTNVRF